jgi:hypothetical protein
MIFAQKARQPSGETVLLAADRRSITGRARPSSTIRQPGRNTVPGMDETQTLAVRALRELLDDPDRDDWDELLAANRALIEAIETGQPITLKTARIVAEYLREAGWSEGAIGAATAQAGARAGTD